MIDRAGARHLLERAAVVATLWASVGAGAVVGSYAAVGYTTQFVVAPIAKAVTVLMPGVVVTLAITALGNLGDRIALATALLLTIGLHGTAAGFGSTLGRRAGAPRLAGGFAALAVAAVALPLSASPRSAAGAAIGAGVVAGIVALATGVESGTPDRREVLAGGISALGVGFLGTAIGRSNGDDVPPIDGGGTNSAVRPVPGRYDDEQERLLEMAGERSLDVEGIEPLVSDSFYEVDISQINPSPDPGQWSLSVTGAVAEEVSHGYEEITDYPAQHRFVTLRCVGENLNGRKMDTALWTGVPVSELIAPANPKGEYVMVRAADGYFEEFPADALADALLAYEMNADPLPRGHGYPARLLVPGHWGEINVKWVTEIEFLREEREGYWEKRGWHGTGPVNTVAKLWTIDRLADGRIEVGGHAYAGTRGIDRVEVSVDGGESWTEADLSDPLPGRVVDGDVVRERAGDAWRQWVHRYAPAGTHEVVVRAVDRPGNRQPRERSDAFPSGPTGWVSKTVNP